MNELDFSFELSPWELAAQSLRQGEKLSALRFLTLLEGESEESAEEALEQLLEQRIMLDISDLPMESGSDAMAVRLRREAQLAAQGRLPEGLEENDPLRLYLEEVAATPAFGDVQVLAEDCARGKESAMQALVNLSLSRVIALAMEQAGKGVLLLDLIQEGSLGLWQSILQFESGNFETHSGWYIRFYIARAITMQHRANGTGARLRRQLEQYQAADKLLLTRLGRNPTMEEIAAELRISAEDGAVLEKMLLTARTMEKAKAQPKESEPEDEQHVEDTAYFQARQRIMELLSVLSEADAKLLTLRFGLEGGLPMSPEETGRQLNLTPEEVVAREAAALECLRRSEQN